MNYSKEELVYLNSKHGGGWIKLPEKTVYNQNEKYVLHATGDATISSGRIYIALPAKTLSYGVEL